MCGGDCLGMGSITVDKEGVFILTFRFWVCLCASVMYWGSNLNMMGSFVCLLALLCIGWIFLCNVL